MLQLLQLLPHQLANQIQPQHQLLLQLALNLLVLQDNVLNILKLEMEIAIVLMGLMRLLATVLLDQVVNKKLVETKLEMSVMVTHKLMTEFVIALHLITEKMNQPQEQYVQLLLRTRNEEVSFFKNPMNLKI